MKKTLAIAGTAALASILAVTAAGCSTSSRNLASLSSNWYYNSSFKKIQPTFTEEAAEILTYTVTQAEKSTNKTYSVEYADGAYATEFYAKKVTAAELVQITTDDWRNGYTNALGNDGYMYLYYYATKLSIPSVTYKLGSEEKTFGEQSVVTESYFFSVEDYLRPVYTKREINRAIPANLQAAKLNEAYSQVDMTYESFYTLSGDSVITRISGTYTELDEVKDAGDTFTLSGLNSHDNSVFDVAYLDITVRAMRNISGSLSQTIGIYTPGLQVRDYTVASSSAALFEGDNAGLNSALIEAILKGKGYFTPQPVDAENPEQGQTQLQTAAVSIAYNGGSYSGVSQTYWFAIGANNNETRTLMVKYSEPLTYNLGKLDYVLTNIQIGK